MNIDELPEFPDACGYDIDVYLQYWVSGAPLWLALEEARKSFEFAEMLNGDI